MKRIVFVILFVCFVFTVKSQQTLYFLQENVYNMNYNPAKPSFMKWHFGIGFSNINLGVSTNIATMNSLIEQRGDTKVINLNSLGETIKKTNNTSVSYDMEILGFGFETSKTSYFSFTTRLRTETYLKLPHEFIKMLSDGNEAYVGEEISSKLSLHHTTYLEFGLGFQKTINQKYTFGIRPKLLLGVANIHTSNADIHFLTTDDWTIRAKAMAGLNTFVPLLEDFTSFSDTLRFGTNFSSLPKTIWGNKGLAFDLGVNIVLPYNLGIGISVADLGYFHWKGDGTRNITVEMNKNHSDIDKDGYFVFDGVNDSLMTMIQSGNKDEIKDYFSNLISENINNQYEYYSMTYPKLFVELFYDLRKHRFSFLSRTDFLKNNIVPSFSFAYNGRFGRVVDLAVTYSIYNFTYKNLGVGLNFHFGPVQLYFVFDNILAPIKPYDHGTVSVQTGLYFGMRHKKDKEKPVTSTGNLF